jgi:hypothetical protein
MVAIICSGLTGGENLYVSGKRNPSTLLAPGSRSATSAVWLTAACRKACRDALRGDDNPPWTEVWSHIAIGKIFDLTGQRDRAVNEYRLAIQTNDDTQGAVNEARLYLTKPYKEPAGQ